VVGEVFVRVVVVSFIFFFFSSRRRHTRFSRDWSSDVCSSDLNRGKSAINILITIKLILFQLLQSMLLLFEQATQHGNFLLHLIQLLHKLALYREASRGRSGIRQ